MGRDMTARHLKSRIKITNGLVPWSHGQVAWIFLESDVFLINQRVSRTTRQHKLKGDPASDEGERERERQSSASCGPSLSLVDSGPLLSDEA
jgi:hypothetical protein